jgi:hypothetical protein
MRAGRRFGVHFCGLEGWMDSMLATVVGASSVLVCDGFATDHFQQLG